ncbi:hypothetical protein CcaCcLH18_10818 [Colletotrichum camelliae]|nr:hypothetical protein CcaCcLH18_10818 [Colletotrichum camelliae]
MVLLQPSSSSGNPAANKTPLAGSKVCSRSPGSNDDTATFRASSRRAKRYVHKNSPSRWAYPPATRLNGNLTDELPRLQHRPLYLVVVVAATIATTATTTTDTPGLDLALPHLQRDLSPLLHPPMPPLRARNVHHPASARDQQQQQQQQQQQPPQTQSRALRHGVRLRALGRTNRSWSEREAQRKRRLYDRQGSCLDDCDYPSECHHLRSEMRQPFTMVDGGEVSPLSPLALSSATSSMEEAARSILRMGVVEEADCVFAAADYLESRFAEARRGENSGLGFDVYVDAPEREDWEEWWDVDSGYGAASEDEDVDMVYEDIRG